MDPVSQMTMGALYAQSIGRRQISMGYVTLVGAVGGLAADADILIKSNADPLLALEYHRHFTHSLFFIPFGGFFVAAVLYYLLKKRVSLKLLTIYATVGYATHALLDACTSYGTQLLWPLSNERFAWDIISIIDPLFTIPILGCVLVSWRLSSSKWSYLAIFYSFLYLGIGLLQNHSAKAVATQLAKSRNHNPVSVTAKPSFANIIVWKTIYEYEEKYYVDAIRIVASDRKVYPGSSIAKLNLERDLSELLPESQLSRDIERFRWFSMDYLAIHPNYPKIVGDIRYSMVPNEIYPLWGIEIDLENQGEHVDYVTARDLQKESRSRLIKMIIGKDL